MGLWLNVRRGLGLLVVGGMLGSGALATPIVPPGKTPDSEEKNAKAPEKGDKQTDDTQKLVQELEQKLKDAAQAGQLKELQEVQMKLLQLQLQKVRAQVRAAGAGAGGPAGGGGFGPVRGFGGAFPGFPFGRPENQRLGAGVGKPAEVLIEQLGLTRDQGTVLEDVHADSAAAKAGLKSNDILLELNGKTVPSDPEKFDKMIDELKAKTPMDAVVMRKGKKETIKGLTLPEADPKAKVPGMLIGAPGGIRIQINGAWPGPIPNVIPVVPGFVPVAPAPPAPPPVPAAPPAPGAKGVSIEVELSMDGTFGSRFQQGSTSIQVKGKTADGKTTISSVEIKNGKVTHAFNSLDEVPAEYKDDVKFLIRRCEKSAAK